MLHRVLFCDFIFCITPVKKSKQKTHHTEMENMDFISPNVLLIFTNILICAARKNAIFSFDLTSLTSTSSLFRVTFTTAGFRFLTFSGTDFTTFFASFSATFFTFLLLRVRFSSESERKVKFY